MNGLKIYSPQLQFLYFIATYSAKMTLDCCLNNVHLFIEEGLRKKDIHLDYKQKQKLHRKSIKAVEEFFKEQDTFPESIQWINKSFKADFVRMKVTIFWAIFEEAIHHPKKKDFLATEDPKQYKSCLDGLVRHESDLPNINLVAYCRRLDGLNSILMFMKTTLISTVDQILLLTSILADYLDLLEQHGIDIKRCLNDVHKYAKEVLFIIETKNIEILIEKFNENNGRSFWFLDYVSN